MAEEEGVVSVSVKGGEQGSIVTPVYIDLRFDASLIVGKILLHTMFTVKKANQSPECINFIIRKRHHDNRREI